MGHGLILSSTYSSELWVLTNQLTYKLWCCEPWLISCLYGYKMSMSCASPTILGWVIHYGLDNQQEESGWRAMGMTSHPLSSCWLPLISNQHITKHENYGWCCASMGEKYMISCDSPTILGRAIGYRLVYRDERKWNDSPHLQLIIHSPLTSHLNNNVSKML
jgi:hypothetical protein